MSKPRLRDPDNTRRRLLKAATTEFADKGLKGARIVSIANAAGTNLQAIYHHFGNKEGIYLAVLESLFTADLFKFDDGADDLDPERALERYIDVLVARSRRDRNFSRLIADQNAQKGLHFKRIAIAMLYFNTVVGTLDAIMKRGVELGVFRPDVSADLLYITISSEVGSYFAYAPMRSAVFGRDMVSAGELDRWLAHFKSFIVRGLRSD